MNVYNSSTSARMPVRFQMRGVSAFCILLTILSLKIDLSRTLGEDGLINHASELDSPDNGEKRLVVFDGTDWRHSLRRNTPEQEKIPTKTRNRVLMGIFSTDTQRDNARRKLIRKTYLSAFKSLNELGLEEGKIDRICALSDLQKDPERFPECTLVYTFVVGGLNSNSTASPTEQLDDNIPFLVDRSQVQYKTDEEDITFLAIQENMNEGKSLTWFKYASTISDALDVDLIAKVDTDTVIFPRGFLEELETVLATQRIERPARMVYGGLRKVGDESYMQGGFYLLSSDVAEFISSSACPRDNIIESEMKNTGYRAEDREIGGFVESFNGTQNILLEYYNSGTHHWRNKEASNFRVMWKDAFAKDVAWLRLKELTGAPNELCNVEEDKLQSHFRWFNERSLKQASHQFKKLISQLCSKEET